MFHDRDGPAQTAPRLSSQILSLLPFKGHYTRFLNVARFDAHRLVIEARRAEQPHKVTALFDMSSGRVVRELIPGQLRQPDAPDPPWFSWRGAPVMVEPDRATLIDAKAGTSRQVRISNPEALSDPRRQSGAGRIPSVLAAREIDTDLAVALISDRSHVQVGRYLAFLTRGQNGMTWLGRPKAINEGAVRQAWFDPEAAEAGLFLAGFDTAGQTVRTVTRAAPPARGDTTPPRTRDTTMLVEYRLTRPPAEERGLVDQLLGRQAAAPPPRLGFHRITRLPPGRVVFSNCGRYYAVMNEEKNVAYLFAFGAEKPFGLLPLTSRQKLGALTRGRVEYALDGDRMVLGNHVALVICKINFGEHAPWGEHPRERASRIRRSRGGR